MSAQSAELARIADTLANLAERMERIEARLPEQEPEWLSAAEVAERFGVSADFVYRNKVRLGARPLSGGPKARLRFNAAEVERALTASPPHSPAVVPPRRRHRRTGSGLLPIKGSTVTTGGEN